MMAVMPEWAGMDDFPGEDFPSEPKPSTLSAIGGAAPVTAAAGDLVTAASAPEGAPPWIGVMETDAGFFELGYPPDPTKGRGGLRYSGPKRLITDVEAIALVEALTFERWAPDEPGDGWRLGGPLWETGGLRVYGSGTWEMWLPGRSLPEFVTGCKGGAGAAKAAASRAFLRRICRGRP